MWPDDPNWQMTGLFLLAVALTGVAMKLVVQFQPSQATEKRSRVFWLLLSPTSHRRLQSIKIRAVLLRTLGSIGLLILCYQVYWPLLVQNLGIRGVILSYAAAPVLLVVSETLLTIVTLLWLPSGQILPALHHRPWAARSVAA